MLHLLASSFHVSVSILTPAPTLLMLVSFDTLFGGRSRHEALAAYLSSKSIQLSSPEIRAIPHTLSGVEWQ
ncbi:hypothetical protein LZ30DRAFT_713122 [Colletotrichum cereale]|nr:hypothetical protein LZ30DRAFT_713122 [Colletotrichum cereale]